MKKLAMVALLALLGHASLGQSLHRGNILGVHFLNLSLNPGVTMDEFQRFFITQYIPAFEKQFKDTKLLLVRGLRGENADSTGVMWVFNSDQIRDKYFNAQGTPTPLGNTLWGKLMPVQQAMQKLGTVTISPRNTDWMVE